MRYLFILLLFLCPYSYADTMGCTDSTNISEASMEDFVWGNNVTATSSGTLDSLTFYISSTNGEDVSVMFTCYEIDGSDTTVIDSTGVVTINGDGNRNFVSKAVLGGATITEDKDYYFMCQADGSSSYNIYATYSGSGSCTRNNAGYGANTWDGNTLTIAEVESLTVLGVFYIIGYATYSASASSQIMRLNIIGD